MLNYLRILGTVLQVGGYISLIQFDQMVGVTLQIVGSALVFPWHTSHRAYDLSMQDLLFISIDIAGLVNLVRFGTLPSAS